MLIIDLIGVVATICLTGIRYPHYVLLAIILHELGKIFFSILMHGQIDTMVAAGVFSTITLNHYSPGIMGNVFIFSGSFINYLASSLTGGIAFEPTTCLLNPLSNLRHPFAVINFRLCIAAGLVSIWKIFM